MTVLPAARRLTYGVMLLIAIQLLTSLGAVVLLGRMSPAIEGILQENVASVEAVEEMALALGRQDGDPETRRRFLEALSRARNNITIAEEAPAIATLERTAEAALAGDVEARREAAAALALLGKLNRDAMRDADIAAQRLGSAGAWAAVFLGLAGLFASGLTLRRLERRVLVPLAEISRAVTAHLAGDRKRRCATGLASGELRLVMTTLNELFDHRERALVGAATREARSDERAALLHLLDARPEPTVVAGAQGEVLAANQRALDLLSGEQRALLEAAVRGEPVEGVLGVDTIGDGAQFLVTLAPGES